MLILQVPSLSSLTKELYNPRAFFTHAASLDQGFPHCPIFPTAASRRSLGRISVPMWLIFLSEQLPIIDLVVSYTTNYLIGCRLLHRRFSPFLSPTYPVLPPVSRCYPRPMGRFLHFTHPSATMNVASYIHRPTCMC